MDNLSFVHDHFYPDVSEEESCIPNLAELQAQCLLLDADEYRSIQHKLDRGSLDIYRFLYSKAWKYIDLLSIIALHGLAFLEYPSSLSFSSVVNKTGVPNPRVEIPPPILFSIEATLLLIICIDIWLRTWLFGVKRSLKHPWMASFLIVMVISWVDFFVSVGLGNLYLVRIRRFIRPIFVMQKSQLMKKVLKSLTKTFIDILSVSLLLLLWIMGFALVAVSIFSGFEKSEYFDEQYMTIYGAFFNLVVLLTTANNPDAMIKEYNYNRLSFIFFLIFMVVGMFVFMNVLFAIVFHDFRGHVLDSMQNSFLHRRIAGKAMFEILNKGVRKPPNCTDGEVDASMLRRVIRNSMIPAWRRTQMIQILDGLDIHCLDWTLVKVVLSPMDELRESKKVFNIPAFDNYKLTMCQQFLLSKSFEIIGLVLCLANVITISVDISYKTKSATTMSRNLEIMNWIFIGLYLLEQGCKLFAMGYKVYFNRRDYIFDFSITIAILAMKISESVLLGVAGHDRTHYLFGVTSIWDLPRITNLLVMLRAARIILLLPSLTPIINTLCDIPGRLRPVIGLLILIFYLYALLGMVLFRGSISPAFMAKRETECGSYQQLSYGALNFSDFYSSIVVLWCLLVVNNWQVFMIAFEEAVGTKWVHLYMMSWWVLAVIVLLNCVTAFVIEGYTQRMTYFEEERMKRMVPRRNLTTVIDKSILYLRKSVVVDDSFTFQMLFKNEFVEPTEAELDNELKRCHYLCKMYPDIVPSNETH